jgi:very-short-patch-repair endonuclease
MPSNLTRIAKRLRSESTRVETLLWRNLRLKQIAGVKFRRQQPIGEFIVDFVSFEKKLIIELDGGQHAKNRDEDRMRDQKLAENGYTVLRFWNSQVLENLTGVLEVIRKKCV